MLCATCSTYYGFCGNAAATGAEEAGPDGGMKAAICGKWLHPIGMSEHPMFSRWVIYGASSLPACSCQSILALHACDWAMVPELLQADGPISNGIDQLHIAREQLIEGQSGACCAQSSQSEGWCAGEAASADSSVDSPVVYVDIPLDGRGLIAIPAAESISPVFTLWVTLVVMYLGELSAYALHCAHLSLTDMSVSTVDTF